MKKTVSHRDEPSNLQAIGMDTTLHPFGLRKSLALLCVFLVSSALLFLDANTALYINNTVVHFVIFFIAVAALPVLIAGYFFGLRSSSVILVILFSALCVSFLTAFLSWNGDWKTQTIIYRNLEKPAQTIEYQMRGDRFSFGYKRQIVQREKVLPFLDLVTPADTSKIDLSKWRHINLVVNEMKIPGEYADTPCP